MLRWILILLIITIIVAILAYSGIFEALIGVAKVLFFVFLALFVLALIIGAVRGFKW